MTKQTAATAIVNANTAGPLGTFDGPSQIGTIATNDQLQTPEAYRSLIVRARNGTVVRLFGIYLPMRERTWPTPKRSSMRGVYIRVRMPRSL